MVLNKRCLILVDNDQLAHALYRRELESSYSVLSCATEPEVWTALEHEPISLIILEPANGNNWAWQFLNRLKTTDRTRHIPVIFCSVLDERKKGLELGADVYLVKPVYAHILHQHVQRVLVDSE